MNKRSRVIVLLANICAACMGLLVGYYLFPSSFISPLGSDNSKAKPLSQYSFPQLRQRSFSMSRSEIGEVLDIGIDVRTYQVFFWDGQKKISAVLTVPDSEGAYPVVVLFRGYVDENEYAPGIGSKRIAEYLTQRGYITIAPDFLGYGASDSRSPVFFESRFQTYTTAVTLLKSLDSITSALNEHDDTYVLDTSRVGIWGHSNGGHIALAALAITGEATPTVLWAPVTRDFPESVEHYASEAPDSGRLVREEVAQLRRDYRIEHFNPAHYYHWIQAPLQVQYGLKDDAIPKGWIDGFLERMNSLGVTVTYYEYAFADHNLSPDWAPAAERTVSFFNREVKGL